ncbi:MAG: PQQ-binding-like beta-propeller repeat protein, partial [Planctomycetota bacterium]
LALPVSAADWPVYRGPNGDGISTETDWKTWGPEGPKTLWKASVGIGYSSVVVADGRLFTMGNSTDANDNEVDTVFCFDAETGKLIWKHTYPCNLQPLYYEGGTLSTPAVDGDAVYTLSKFGDLFRFEAATGKITWEVNVRKDLGFDIPTWSYSSAALIDGDRLILNLGDAGAAIDKHTGRLLWHNGKGVCGYATPVEAVIEGQRCFVIGGATHVIGIRADDGKVLWKHPFENKHKATAADPIIRGNEVFASHAYDGGSLKLKIENNKPRVVFENRVMRTLMSNDVLWGDQIYGFDEYDLKCIDFADSKERWDHRGFGKGSLSMSADGRMLIMSERGELIIAQANTDEFKLLARAQVLPKSMCRTTPVLANGLIYARNANGDLACIDVR